MPSVYRLLPLLPVAILLGLLLSSCSSTKYVPDGNYLLVDAKVKSDNKDISEHEMQSYIKQKPNFKTFTIYKLPLTIYNLSGKDSTKLVNKILRRAGDSPVIYDSTMVNRTAKDLKRMMVNKGYLDASVTPIVMLNGKKAVVTYNIKPMEPFKINSYKINISDSLIAKIDLSEVPDRIIKARNLDTASASLIDTIFYRNSLVQKGANFDLNVLDAERDRLTTLLHRIGFYAFNKEYIGFIADTIAGNKKVDLELRIYPFEQQGQNRSVAHRQYRVKEVDLYIDYNPLVDGDVTGYRTSSIYANKGYKVMYGSRGKYIDHKVLLNSCHIRPGSYYNEGQVTQTYNSLSQLRILKNINIGFVSDSTELRGIITCVPDKRQGISSEFDGTYSGGYFGVRAGTGYLHRNAFRGSELFSVKFHGAYEAITPNFSRFGDNYFEIGGETSLTFPQFMFPFLKTDYKRRIHASTQFTANYSFQRRPGFFTRTILSSGVKYIWQDRRRPLTKHVFDLIDVSYIHIPPDQLDPGFKDKLTPAAFKYSFTDQFILGSGYLFTNTNLNVFDKQKRSSHYTFRGSIESAGNLLALIAHITDIKPDENGSKEIFGTKFVQYTRVTADYSKTYNFDDKNSMAWRLGGGAAIPYGNYKEIPIQKRFFSGGANSVRGWTIRYLGPGGYYPTDKDYNNFFYHSGDIRLDANIEYRSKIFWIIELAAFLDAGNIWNVNKQEKLNDAEFKFDRFYKEIAAAWGLGMRFDFNFVLVRLDCGWKAYDPSNHPNANKWPIKDPLNMRKNASLHIAVGYPF